MPKFSIIIPIYNVEDYLFAALSSIENQSLSDFEVIMVNDGSSDRSAIIAEEFANKDERFRLYTQQNSGPSAARNLGIDLAKGKFLYFFDSDDLLELNALESFFTIFETTKVDAYLFSAKIIGDKNNLLNEVEEYERCESNGVELSFDYLGKVGRRDIVQPCCYCIRRSTIGAIRFPVGVLYEDNVFYYKYLLSENRALFANNSRFFCRRIRSNSTMTSPVSSNKIFSINSVAIQLIDFYKGSDVSKDLKRILLPVCDRLLGDTYFMVSRLPGLVEIKTRYSNFRLFLKFIRVFGIRSFSLKRFATALFPELYR